MQTGKPNLEDTRNHFLKIKQDPNYNLGFNFLFLMKKVELNSFHYDTISDQRGEYISLLELLGNAKIAGLYSDPVEFGIARQWQSVLDTETLCLKSFLITSEALKWLDLPEDYILPYQDVHSSEPF